MPNRYTHEQTAAHDDKGERHVVMVTRSPIPGSPLLQGPPHYTWNDGQTLHLIDDKAGILECVRTRQRLKIEDLARLTHHRSPIPSRWSRMGLRLRLVHEGPGRVHRHQLTPMALKARSALAAK